MRKKNDTENMPILLDKSVLLSHWKDAVWFVTLFKEGGKSSDFRDKQWR